MRQEKKEYIESEEVYDDEEGTEPSEETNEEDLEDQTWTDADGNPIVSVKDE